ncbi:hypothetical protein ACI3PL_25630, partial [Lacticaseibacillus paracasei]
DAATVGMLYMAAEWKRPSVIPQAGGISYVPPAANEVFGNRSEPAGADVAGAVWLSASRHPSMSESAMKTLVVQSQDIREKNPMWFL